MKKRENSAGMYGWIEGGECAGKGGVMRDIADRYPDIVRTREPGGTELAEEIRAMILKEKKRYRRIDYRNFSPLVQAYLFNAARAHHVDNVIAPALAEGKHVVSDRFHLATFAYQGGCDAGIVDFLVRMDAFTLGHREDEHGRAVSAPRYPDYGIYIDVAPEEELRRTLECRTKAERNHFDATDIAKIEVRRRMFLGTVSMLRKLYPVHVVDGNRPEAEVREEVIGMIRDYDQKRFR